MASNPMQRKSRTSFLLGMLITLVIMGAIVAFLFMQLTKMKNEENERIAASKTVYVLSTDVKSGENLTVENFTTAIVDGSAVPSNAITTSSLNENTIAKIDLSAGTILTDSMVEESENKTTKDSRLQEYNMISLASHIASNDYIDIRLRMPSGLDYIVVSKKRLETSPVGESANTVWMKLSEDEILTMSNAIVESYITEGSLLYAAKYVEPGMQEEATPTYVPSANVQYLISSDSNITNEAKNALITRYNNNTNIRENINGEKPSDADEASSLVSSGTQTEIQTTQEQRQQYLQSLTSGTTDY